MQLLVGVDGLGCIKQVFQELAAQIHIHLLKGAFAVHEPLEIALHLGLVKKAVVFIENGFVALVAQVFRSSIFYSKSRELTYLGLNVRNGYIFVYLLY